MGIFKNLRAGAAFMREQQQAAMETSPRFIPPTPALRPPRIGPSALNLTQGLGKCKPAASDATNRAQTALRMDATG